MLDASTSESMSPGLQKVAEQSRESRQRKSRMVEISLSGSGEGPGRVTGRGYSTTQAGCHGGAPASRAGLWKTADDRGWDRSRALAGRTSGTPKVELIQGLIPLGLTHVHECWTMK